MRLTSARNVRSRYYKGSKPPLRITLLLAAWIAGCNNTCFTFTSNPPTGTIDIKAGNPPPACTLTKATSAVRLVVETVARPNFCPEHVCIQHLFASIRGIEVHANSAADENSPDWQELAPQLAKQPLQVDLIQGGADQGTRESLGESVSIPAGVYRQVRVRLIDALPAKDGVFGGVACGGASFNCAVMGDGTIQPLLFDTASAEVRIVSEAIEDTFFLLPPDMESNLILEIQPVWSWDTAANGRDAGPALMLTARAKVERAEVR